MTFVCRLRAQYSAAAGAGAGLAVEQRVKSNGGLVREQVSRRKLYVLHLRNSVDVLDNDVLHQGLRLAVCGAAASDRFHQHIRGLRGDLPELLLPDEFLDQLLALLLEILHLLLDLPHGRP